MNLPNNHYDITAQLATCDFFTSIRNYGKTEDMVELYFDNQETDTRTIVKARIPQGRGETRIEVVRIKGWNPALKCWDKHLGTERQYRIGNQRGAKALREAIRQAHREQAGHDYMPSVWTHAPKHSIA